MNNITKAALATALVAFLMLGSFFWGKRVADFYARMHELETNNATLRQQYDELKNSRKQIERETGNQVAATRRIYAEAAKNPQTSVDAVNSAIPNLNLTLKPGELPDAPSVAVIANAPKSLPSLVQYVQEAEICKIELAGCKKTLVVADAQVTNLNGQVTNLTEQVKTVRGAKGMGTWGKVKNCGARVVIGGIAGALSKDANKAVIGAGLGVGSCFVF